MYIIHIMAMGYLFIAYVCMIMAVQHCLQFCTSFQSQMKKMPDWLSRSRRNLFYGLLVVAQLSRFPQASALVPWWQHVQHIGRHNKQSLRRFLFAVLDLTQWCHVTMQCIQLHVWSTPIIRNNQFNKNVAAK